MIELIAQVSAILLKLENCNNSIKILELNYQLSNLYREIGKKYTADHLPLDCPHVVTYNVGKFQHSKKCSSYIEAKSFKCYLHNLYGITGTIS